ncbi:hypothetical protein [Chamaesiphon sp.]|uniref:hypothetical protein n=1 Tax=Chamaesiphon sp. TaxID=2814140 RepID=UPI0035941F58
MQQNHFLARSSGFRTASGTNSASPNYKVEAGDSLTAPVIANQQSARDVFVKEFQKLKSEFLTAHGQAKKASLKKEIDRVKEQIAIFTHGSNKVNGFDWVVEFSVFFHPQKSSSQETLMQD